MTELEYDAMTDPDLDRALADVEAALDRLGTTDGDAKFVIAALGKGWFRTLAVRLLRERSGCEECLLRAERAEAALATAEAERESVCNDSYDALEYFRCAWRRCSTTSSRHGEALRTEVFRLQAEVAALREQLAAANERWERLMAGLKTGGLPTDLPINAHDNALRYVKTLMATLEAEARQKGTP